MPIPREPAFEVAEYRRRLERVHRSMASRSLDALVLFSPHNVFYLSGMDTENLSDYQCLLVPAGGDPILVTSHFEEARAANSCWHRGQVFYGPYEDPLRATLEAVRRLKVRTLAWSGAAGRFRQTTISRWQRHCPTCGSRIPSVWWKIPGWSNRRPRSPACAGPPSSPISGSRPPTAP